jgi:hypothetical protein
MEECNMFDVKEIDAETGQETTRNANAEEVAQAKLDVELATAAEAAKETALDKLTKLGLEIADLQALGLI